MDNFYIKNIVINNFRGYNGEKKYSFEDNSGNPTNIILLSGPNGYGKTTLIDSIEWCITGNIKRVYDDYMKRCSQKVEREIENSAKGLIYNINAKEKYVFVQIEGMYKGYNIRIKREFNDDNEINAFQQISAPHIDCDDAIKNELVDIMKGVRDNFNFNNICSYDKNIDLYKKGRTDIYDFFEATFSQFNEVKKIIDNLNDFKDKLNAEKDIIEGNITKLSKSKEDKETVLKQINKTENIKIRKYPDVPLFKTEINLDESYLVKNDAEIDLALEKQVEILTDILYKQIESSIDNIIEEKGLLIKISKNKKLKNIYLNEKDNIDYIRQFDIKKLKNDKNQLISFKDKIKKIVKYKEIDLFIGELQLDSSIYNKYLSAKILDKIKNEYNKIINNNKTLEILNKQKELYDDNSPVIKAMRYIVDNKVGYEIYKEKNEVCPLCGNEFLPNSEIGEIAKEFLGSKDIERQILVKDIDKYNINNESIIENIKGMVLSTIENSIDKINNILLINEELEEIFILSKDLNINIKDLSMDLLEREEVKFEKELSEIINKSVKEVEIINLLIGLKSPFLLKYTDEINSYKDKCNEEKLLMLYQIKDELKKNYSKIEYSINEVEYNISSIFLVKDKLDITKEVVLYKTNNSINNEIKEIKKEIIILNEQFKIKKEKIKRINKYITDIKKIKVNNEKLETERIAEPLSAIYRKITRNTNITQINLKKVNANKKSSLDIIDLDGNNIPFGNIMSAGQVSTLAISIYLAKAVLSKDSTFKLYMMDDPIQTMDDLNVISLIDLLRFQFMQPKEDRFIDQLFISTCDEDLEKLILHKMNSFSIPIINQNFII